MRNTLLIVTLTLILVGCTNRKTKSTIIDINNVSFNYSILVGLEPEEGICRRDPSDVIKVSETYYLWYTKSEKTYSGYDASIWYATSKNGENWEEKGEAISRGDKGSWDEFSVFTPNISKTSGKYYLFYTGVKPTSGNPEGKFENNSENDITAIGLAISNYPDGPFIRTSPNPILEISDSSGDFDSYRIDDACIIYKDNQYWLYYKGRSRKYGKEGPKHTKLGVAISIRPGGPYKKYENNPIITSGHEVMVWPFQNGVMALISDNGLEGKTLQYSVDGLSFNKVGSFGNDYPKAPGSFRIGDFTDASEQVQGISWGISMFYGSKEKWPHLLKYEIKLDVGNLIVNK